MAYSDCFDQILTYTLQIMFHINKTQRNTAQCRWFEVEFWVEFEVVFGVECSVQFVVKFEVKIDFEVTFYLVKDFFRF